jgi:hypothetical protein
MLCSSLSMGIACCTLVILHHAEESSLERDPSDVAASCDRMRDGSSAILEVISDYAIGNNYLLHRLPTSPIAAWLATRANRKA